MAICALSEPSCAETVKESCPLPKAGREYGMHLLLYFSGHLLQKTYRSQTHIGMSVSANLDLISGVCNYTHGQSFEGAYLSISIVTALGGIHLPCHDGAAVSKAALILHRQTQLR